MTSQDERSREEAKRKIVAFVVGEMKKGVPKEGIVAKLRDAGVDPAAATNLVHSIHADVLAAVERERPTSTAVLWALTGASLAAIVGGIIWGLIVILTDYEIGYMATGIGLLCGFAVVTLSKSRGPILQIIAVGGSLLGILIGKYVSFYAILRNVVAEEYGAEAANALSVFSPDVARFFLESLGELASPYDILWIILAILAAWRIPKGMGIRIPTSS